MKRTFCLILAVALILAVVAGPLYSGVGDKGTGTGGSNPSQQWTVLTAAPASPVERQPYLADGVNWNPANISGTTPYWVLYCATCGTGSTAKYTALADIYGNLLIANKEPIVPGGTCSTSYTIDPSASTLFTLTLNGACAIGATNLAAGQSFMVRLTQSSTTAPTFTGGVFVWASGTAPTWSTTATKYDEFSCIVWSTSVVSCSGRVDVR